MCNSVGIDKESRKNFHTKIFDWWKDNKRDLPWRDPKITPYEVMVSEFMLQQTQVNRIIPLYLKWMKELPDIESLAKLSKKKLLSLWSGLGYNRRAIWLQEAASQILELGYFPSDPDLLIRFKGIGRYTSRSIPIFALNANLAAVDINVRRIYIKEGFISENATVNEMYIFAKDLIPYGKSRDYHSALFDYGSQMLTARSTGISSPRQSKFKGSNRELRGKIIKLLTQRIKISMDEMNLIFKNTKYNLKIICEELAKDGLIVFDNDLIFIE